MKKLTMLLLLTIACALPMAAQYEECRRCETAWAITALTPPHHPCVIVSVVHREAKCEQAPAALASYEQCAVSKYNSCGHANPFQGDPGPWSDEEGCYSRRPELDQHCHVFDPCRTNEPPPGSPIVINFGKRWDFSGTDDPVLFDLLGHGTVERWTWTARDSDIAFLALDRNGDGQITSGQELFGDWNPDPHSGTTNGFDWLKSYDTTDDGYIMEDDAIWTHLLLWFDRDHDAISQPGELKYLAAYVDQKAGRIWALDTDYRQSDREDGDGNRFLYKSKVHFIKNGRPKTEKYFDIYFVKVP